MTHRNRGSVNKIINTPDNPPIKEQVLSSNGRNFILFKTKHPAGRIFAFLAKNGILVRNLSSYPKLNNCLRVTVGTKNENDRFLSKLKDFKS